MANWEAVRKEWETSKITLADLADKHDIKLGTLKSRKSREKWSRDATASEKVATPSGRVATTDEKKGAKKATSNGKKSTTRKRSGNPNPTPKFPKRNTAAVKHGLFSKYLPKETLDIMDDLLERDPADMMWDQIQIQYAAIIRAQRIMWVEDRDDMTKELKKEEQGEFAEKKEWEIQFAWDKHANFLNAQSRAIGELRSSIKQFVAMADEADERRLKLDLMRKQIDTLSDDKKDTDWAEAIKEVAEKRRRGDAG